MMRWCVTIDLASIENKRIKLRIKLNHSIPLLNPHLICINITIFSGVHPIDLIHLQTKMAPVHFTTTKLYLQGLNFSDLFCVILWVVPGFSWTKSSGWMYQLPCFWYGGLQYLLYEVIFTDINSVNLSLTKS